MKLNPPIVKTEIRFSFDLPALIECSMSSGGGRGSTLQKEGAEYEGEHARVEHWTMRCDPKNASQVCEMLRALADQIDAVMTDLKLKNG